MNKYIDWLEQKNIRVTANKTAILEVLDKHKHLDAVQISSILDTQNTHISQATIYRVIAELEKHEIISKLNFGNEHSVYEIQCAESHHDHLICLECGLVVEFTNEKIEELQLEIANSKGFSVITHSLNLYGKCSKCN
ncbi:MAG: Fur family transcriptional regulator [Burkholderiales bacterium]|nr:Fur family transcriptional regulator [Burkholderiales bacterium]